MILLPLLCDCLQVFWRLVKQHKQFADLTLGFRETAFFSWHLIGQTINPERNTLQINEWWRLSLVGALRLIRISNAKTRKKKKNSKGGKLRFPTRLIHAWNEMMLWKGNFAISFQFLVRKRSCYKTIRSFLHRNCSVTTQPVSVKKVDITFTVELPEKIVLQPLQAWGDLQNWWQNFC